MILLISNTLYEHDVILNNDYRKDDDDEDDDDSDDDEVNAVHESRTLM
jgi:hypothetical protein